MNPAPIKPLISTSDLDKIDVRVGTILAVEDVARMPQGMTRPIGIKPEGSKVDRMAAQSAKIEAGHVHLPNSAPWLGEFLTELLSFPNGRHDDQVDSVSQFLRWLQNDAYNQISFVAPILISRADMGLPPLHIDWSCRH